MKLIEAVPNFSTADPSVVEKIVDVIEQVENTHVLHVDPDQDYNRTVITFTSPLENIVNSSFQAISMALREIDMRHHQGEHPRLGAVDVFPWINLGTATQEQLITKSHELSELVAQKFQVPVYNYAHSARRADRTVLAAIRRGQYEGLADKLKEHSWKPDAGPATFVPQSGAVVIGVRDFLIAYNININSKNVDTAQDIARKIRTSGYVDSMGTHHPGYLENVQAMGVTLHRSSRGKFTQVSTNILDFRNGSNLDEVYSAVQREAEDQGVKVTGSEIVGLVPEQALLSALSAMGGKPGKKLSEQCERLGLHDLYQFRPDEKVLEYVLAKFYPQYQ